jgi:hypothetical protein
MRRIRSLESRGPPHVVHRVDRAAVLVDDRHLGAGALQELGHEPSMTFEPSKRSGY